MDEVNEEKTEDDSEGRDVAGAQVPWKGEEDEGKGEEAEDGNLDAHVGKGGECC